MSASAAARKLPDLGSLRFGPFTAPRAGEDAESATATDGGASKVLDLGSLRPSRLTVSRPDHKNTASAATASAAGGLPSDLGSLRPDPLVLWRPRRRDWQAQTICLCAAVAMHVGGYVAFMYQPPLDDRYGAGGQHLEAIEIEIVVSSVMESNDQKPDNEAMDVDQPAQEAEPTPPEVQEAKPQAEEMETALEPEPTKPEEQPKPQVQEAVPTSGPAAASAGVMSRYAAEVRRALAKNKPKGRGLRGTVTVKFTISSAGQVSAAEVTGSSGNGALDAATLAAVQRTAFLRPPPGMSERDLTYMVPFRFQTK